MRNAISRCGKRHWVENSNVQPGKRGILRLWNSKSVLLSFHYKRIYHTWYGCAWFFASNENFITYGIRACVRRSVKSFVTFDFSFARFDKCLYYHPCPLEKRECRAYNRCQWLTSTFSKLRDRDSINFYEWKLTNFVHCLCNFSPRYNITLSKH